MAKNQSPYYVHVETKDGGIVAVAPGEDIPSGVEIDNPYVTGKKDADELPDELPPLPEAGDGAPAAEAAAKKAEAEEKAAKDDDDSKSSSTSTRSSSRKS